MENKGHHLPEETPGWLQELQLRSWEPEVLLSGIVLYGMFKTPEILDNFFNFFQANISGASDFRNLISILKIGTYWLIFGLILHLVSRGIWVGMVGLSSTFPEGINTARVRFTGRFKSKVERIPPFQKIIINLEKICSALFSMSFMLFMCVIGSYLYIFVLLVIPVFVIIYIDPTILRTVGVQIWVTIVLLIGLIGFLDFVTLGFFKRFAWFAKIYWPIDKVISTLTLSRFYRPIYYAFASNFNRWIMALAFILFAVISIFGLDSFSGNGYYGDELSQVSLWHNRTGTSAFSGYYDDQNEDRFSTQAQIPTDIIDGNVIKLFIPVSIDREKIIKDYTGYDSLRKTDSDKDIDQFDLAVVKSYYQISLDDSLLTSLDWFYQYKMKTQQRGYIIFIDITSLPQGVHTLTVASPDSKRKLAEVPFYREVRESARNTVAEDKEKKEEYFQMKPGLPK